MKKFWLKISLVLILTTIFLYIFFKSVDWKEVLFYLGNFDKRYLLLIIILTPFHYVTRAAKWRYLFVSRKKNIKFSNLFSANVIGFMVSYLLPLRAGEIVRPVYLGQKENISRSFSFGTVVVERIFDLLTVLFLFGFFWLLKPFYHSYFQEREQALSHLSYISLIALSIGLALISIIIFLFFFQSKAISVISFFLKPFPKISQKAIHISKNFLEGLNFFHSPPHLILYLFFSLVQWVFIGFFSWLVLYSFGIYFPFPLIVPYLILTMVGASIPTPGMVGGFHALSKMGLISLYGVDTNLAVGATIALHAIIYISTIVMGAIILWKEGISFAQIRKLEREISV
ncbi:MAG: lysylphosphatidylglycerol synthase transmembrane domain-containing protein [Candidatus Aminicenantia bacterium]